MLRKWKRVAIGATAVTITGSLALTAIMVPLLKQKKYKIQYFENGGALQSLNYVTRGGTALSSVYGFSFEGLIKSAAPEILTDLTLQSLNKRKWTKKSDYYQGVIKKFDYKDGVPDLKMKLYNSQTTGIKASDFDPITGDPKSSINFEGEESQLKGSAGSIYEIAMADIVENYLDENNRSLRARIHENAYWSNGAKVTADDFVQTIKYILDKRSGSVVQQKLYETLKLRGAKEIVTLQNKEGYSFQEAWDKVKKDGNLPVTVDGTERKWVNYHFEKGAMQLTHLADYLGGDVFIPTNKKFIDSIGGILKYGQTKSTVLSNGPFKPDELDLDYLITYERNPYYYESESVLLDHPAYKVSPSQAIQMQLFKDGKLSNIRIPQAFLQSFYSDPKLAALVNHGATSPQTSGAMFSKVYANKHPNAPSGNKNFRKAILYGMDRNAYAAYSNAAGSAPANMIYTPRALTKTFDENGKSFYDYMLNQTYKEEDPISGKTVEIPFLSYDRNTQLEAFYSEQHNNSYTDHLNNELLANHFLEQYFKETGRSSAKLNVMITASEENNYLAFKNIIESTFHGKIEIEAELVASQVMTERNYTGNFEVEFSGAGTSSVDPWGVYSYYAIEDGYDEKGAFNAQGQYQEADAKSQKLYLDEQGNGSMEVTSRYWRIPGFELRDYANNLSPSEIIRLNITDRDKQAYEEAATSTGQGTKGYAPVYKYTNDESLISGDPDGMMEFQKIKVPRALTPHVSIDPTKQSNWLFKYRSDLFDWYYKTEVLLRDSSYFVPLLSSMSGFFAERRGLRSAGNSQSMPYGYQYIYPSDNNYLIEEIEKNIEEKMDVSITLERI